MRPRLDKPSVPHTPLALAALLALGATHVQAQPAPTTLPQLRPGGALVNATVGTPSGSTLNITQTTSGSNRALIEWSSFSIGSQARVNISQPNAQSLLVNRVVGGPNGASASEIHGALSANGRVMLVNPAGVMFGPSAQVNVGSLVASSLDLGSGMTDNGYERLMRGDDIVLSGGNGAGLQVMAADDPRRPQIQVTEGGSIVLLAGAPIVQNGVVSAPRGEVNIATGSAAVLRPVGTSGFVEVLSVQPGEPRGGGIGLGAGSQTLASGGRVVVGGQPNDAGTARNESVTVAGTVSTDSATGPAGSIHLDAGPDGDLQLREGAVVTASSSGATGGSVALQGGSITVRRGDLQHPQVLADGATGGGQIVVGNAATRAITVDEGTLLSADATRNGHGGSIRLRAMYDNRDATSPVARVDFGVTEAYGVLRARGGTEGGDGGAIETSGLAVSTSLLVDADLGLSWRGSFDASARSGSGRAGAWTLDPYDITISNAPTVAVNGSFNPTGPGANVQASDLSAALDAGTSIEISTEAGGAEAGNITIASGTVITRNTGTAPTTLTLRANHSIVIDGATLDASRAGPVNLNLFADLDGNSSGRIAITGSTLLTGGGGVTMAGGTNPAAGFARGDATTAGVSITGGTLDTRSTTTPGTAGNLVIRGQGGVSTTVPAGVVLAGTMHVGNLDVHGLASHGTAVLLNGADIRTAGGNLSIRGIATRVDTNPTNVYGVDAVVASVQLGTGSMTIAGRGDDSINPGGGGGVGLRVGDVRISADTASTGTITLAGESLLSIAPGIQSFIGGNGGLVIRSDASSTTSAATGANVVIGALSSVGPTSLELGRVGFIPTILTTGGINIRPLGVNGSGALVEQPGVSIVIRPGGSNAGPLSFAVNTNLLQSPAANGGISAGGGVVIGSQGHIGAILVDNGALNATQHAGSAINLQNEGVESGGINLGSGNTVGNLGLLTGGDIVQTGALSVQNLVIRGGTGSNVTLDNAANQVSGVLAFDPPSSLVVRTAGDLTIDAAAVRSFDAANGFAPLAITSSLGGNNVLLQAGGNVAVNQSIGMAGTAAPELQIVSPGNVGFAAGATLSAGNGRWRVWSPTVTGSPSAGTATNLYGCVFGDSGACSVSGIALPAAGNLLLHPTQPTLTVVASTLTGYADLALPELTFTATGLLNGDTTATALTGSLAANRTGATTFDVVQGTLASPNGYLVEFTPATLTVRPGFTRHMLQSGFLAENVSDVYGRNLDQPFVCTAASVMRGTLGTTQADPLAAEWGKVRNQPQLSGCLNVTDGGQCSAF